MTARNPSDSPCATSRDEDQASYSDVYRSHRERKTAAQFPLASALGVRIDSLTTQPFVDAHMLEAALAAAPVLRASQSSRGWCMFEHDDGSMHETHTFRAVCPQPIVRDTAELIVKDLADYARRVDADEYFDRAAEWSELKARASKLLGKG